MDFTSAVVGGVIGIGSTLLVDRIRDRRAAHEQLLQIQREAFAAFLAAVPKATLALRDAVRTAEADGTSISRSVQGALGRTGFYESYHLLALITVSDVVTQANRVLLALEHVRDVISETHGYANQEFVDARAELFIQQSELRNVMRKCIGLNSLATLPDGAA